MAISTNASILALLKVYYKDGVQNLMFRNSPVLRKINKVRVEGREVRFATMYGRGGAVSADFTKALANAASVSQNAEFVVAPGQLFSVYIMNAKQVQASVTKKGAYMKIAGANMFASAEALRKTLASCLYGRGYGEICASGYSTAIVANTSFTLTLPDYAIMAIDVNSILSLKSTVTSSTVNANLTVTAINGNTVTVKSDTAVASPAATDILCIAGGMDASGNPIYPIGLGSWIPTVAGRTGSNWDTYIGTSFCNVNRSICPDRLAGAFYNGTSVNEAKNLAVQKLLKRVRRQGSTADLIVVNDDDWLSLSQEIQTTQTYFTQTTGKAKAGVSKGINNMAFGLSTSWVENIYDDPYCPAGRFYILDSSTVEFWSYTNTDKVNDGVADNEPGKQDPMAMDGDGQENTPYGLIIDDYLNVQSGTGTVDGPATNVTLQLFGSFTVMNPSNVGVGEFYGSTDFALSQTA